MAAYNPIRPDGIPVQQPALGLAGTTNSFMSVELENIHRGQHTAMQRRAPRQNQKGKSKGKEQVPEAASAPPVHSYEGTDTQCSIYQHEFQSLEMVTRLVCNHQYHEICWDSYQHTDDADSHECPNCRRPGTAKACYQHLGAHNPNKVRPRQRNDSRGANSSDRPRFLPGATPPSSESSFWRCRKMYSMCT